MKNIIETVGTIVVILSLFAVIYELRQTQSTIEASVHSQRTDRNLSQIMWNAENGILSLRRKRHGTGELTAQEKDLLQSSDLMSLRHFEDLHFQHGIGTLDDATWEANLAGIRRRATDKHFMESTKDANVRAEFRELLNELSTGSEPDA